MIYKSHYLQGKEYSTKEDMFADLKANISDIMAFKKSVQKSKDKDASITCRPLDLKRFNEDEVKALKLDDNYYYLVMNTTNILDSHDDVHIVNIWKKTINDKQYRNYLVTDHELEVLNTVVRKEYVEIFTAKIPFSALGKSYNGNTEALIYKVPKDKVMIPIVKDWLESGDAIEGSVRMRYINYVFCLDSNNPEDTEFKKNYDKYIDQIANKEDFEYIPYFFAILEASNELESSLVIRGSNSITGQYTKTNETEPSNHSEEIKEPAQVTQQKTNINLNLFI